MVSRASSFVAFALLLGACTFSQKGTSTGAGTSDPAPGGPAEGPQAATEKGKIVDFNTKKPVPNATVKAGDQTTTTAADGTFALTVQKGEKFQLAVTAPGYAGLLEQETSLDADYDRGSTNLVPQSLANLLTGMLTGYDAQFGILSVQVIPTGACSSEDGATIKVSPEAGAKVVYFAGGLPNASLTAVKGGEFPSAAIYNVQPGVPLSLTVEHATCKEAPFPVQQGAVLYTGGISAESGESTAFARVFLQ